MRKGFVKLISALVAISMIFSLFSVMASAKTTLGNGNIWYGDDVSVNIASGDSAYNYVIFAQKSDPRGNFYYYETSNHTVNKTSGGAVHVFVMVDASENSGEWSPSGLYDSGNRNYDLVYCCDAVTPSEAGTYFKRLNLEDSEYYSDDQAKQIRAILENSYPFVSVEGMRSFLKEKGFEYAEELDRSEMISAVQAAVWSVSNADSGDSYDYKTTATTKKKLTWGAYLHEFAPEITNFKDSTTSQKYTPYASVGNRVNALRDFLLALEPVEAKDDQIVISNLEIVETVPSVVAEDTYQVSVHMNLNHAVGENDDITLTVTSGEVSCDVELEAGVDSYTMVVETKSTDVIKATVSGTQELARGVYFYAPMPADLDGDGVATSREVAQNMVGIASGETAVYAEAEVNVDIYTVSGSKTWNDDNNRDGVRPESITINLLANGKVVDTRTVTAADNWEWDFAVFNNKGNVYTITEDVVADYTTEINGFDVVNTHIPEVVSVSGSKTWDDNNNQDGKRPESITIVLFADSNPIAMKTVTAADGWAWTFENLPKCEDGEAISYSVAETPVESYTAKVEGYNIINTLIPEVVSVSGSKTWDDNNNQDGKRPESIEIVLLANGETVEIKTVTAADGWAWTFENLPKYENGEEISYAIAENPVKDYTTKVDGYNVTNIYTPGKINVSGFKTWNDSNDKDGSRPESITIYLFADGEFCATKVVTEADGWAWDFTDLDQYANGKEIVYTITENIVKGYTTEINGFNVVNTHVPELVSVSGSKTWNDNDNQEGLRPESITINLLANGVVVGSEVVTAESGWAWTFDNLPKYSKGVEIVYTISEDAVPGYTTTVNGYDVVNTYNPEDTSITVNKVWVDDDNFDGYRPESITVHLYADGALIATKTITEADNWTWTFTGLDKYNSNGEIVYTVVEEVVEYYETTITATENGFEIVNEYLEELEEPPVPLTPPDTSDFGFSFIILALASAVVGCSSMFARKKN